MNDMYEHKQRMLSKNSKNISDSMIRIQPQNFGGNKYSKNIRVTIQIIMSQDFGGNKYSKIV